MTFLKPTTEPVREEIQKADGLGRLLASSERRDQLLDEYERSGLSAMKFSALVGVKYQTFMGWRYKRRKRPASGSVPAKAADTMRWLEAVVEQAQSSGVPSSCAIVLELAGGARVQVNHPNQAVLAAALVRALEKSC